MSFAAPMAFWYDALNDDAHYEEERDRLVAFFPSDAKKGADLGCGTGSLVTLLARDFDMTAVDLSEEMLAHADAKAFEMGASVRFVCQDIRSLSLGQKFDFCLCLHDTLNYILDTDGLSRVFERVAAHLNGCGVFLFDINTRRRFEAEYAKTSVVLEREGLFCVWEREYNEKRRICDFVFHFFEEDENGRYLRTAEFERQRFYSPRTVEKLCLAAGMKAECVFENENHLLYKATLLRG